MSAVRSVLFVAPSAYKLGGLATWLDYLLPTLRMQGWNARLALVSGRLFHRPDQYLLVHPDQEALVAHCETDTPVGRRLALERLLKRVRPDIAVSVNIPDLFVAMNRLRESNQCATRAVMSVHGIERSLFEDMARYRGTIDAAVCTNRLACALSQSLGGVDGDRVHYAACGVTIPGKEAPEQPSPDGESDRLRIVYSGRLETPQKRCMDLVDVVQRLDQLAVPYVLDVAGDGPDRQRLQEALREQIARGSVVLHGFLTAQELHQRIYAQADAMLVTSSWETGPIVAWEAMAYGMCLVSSRYIGSRLEGSLEDGVNALLFDVGDTRAAANALERIWRDQGLRTTLRRGGERLVSMNYSTSASTEAWSNAFARTLANQALPAVALPSPRRRGRLDRWVGTERGENIRSLFGVRRSVAAEPGDEWPHTHSASESDENFWDIARRWDARIGREGHAHERHR
ncbi:glycosyltransferase family 4 protein [Arenimonas sp.]|uniref:glycosyltransferase family 4 protein n=1 Tax=Arenimonas sp. TaxID=1872635 RepID=UPI0039E5038F